MTAEDQCGKVFTLSTVTDEEPSLVDSSDDSKSRFPETTEEAREHKYGGEPLKDMSSNIESRDELISQCQNVTLPSNNRPWKDGIPSAPIPETNTTEVFHRRNDTSDDSGIRTQMKAVKSYTTRYTNSETVRTSGFLTNDYSDESIGRDNRCSLSTVQKAQQPVTAVQQNRCIEPTVVNSVSIDKCLVTNKPELTKQHSSQTSNKWLSSTLSRFTSSMLGSASKNKTGEEFDGNINPNSPNIFVKPEFNFFL